MKNTNDECQEYYGKYEKIAIAIIFTIIAIAVFFGFFNFVFSNF